MFFEYHNEGNEEMKRPFQRKESYVANVLIIEDVLNPKNEGKVFLFKYGKQIHEKIMEMMFPPKTSSDKPIIVFDPYDGATFKLKIKTKKVGKDKSGMPNYENSSFEGKSCLEDDVIDKAMAQVYPIAEFIIAPDQVESYDSLKLKMNNFLSKNKFRTLSDDKKDIQNLKAEDVVVPEEKKEVKAETVSEASVIIADKVKEVKAEVKVETPVDGAKEKAVLNLVDEDDDFIAGLRNKNKK
jgi:hypothetical protein